MLSDRSRRRCAPNFICDLLTFSICATKMRAPDFGGFLRICRRRNPAHGLTGCDNKKNDRPGGIFVKETGEGEQTRRPIRSPGMMERERERRTACTRHCNAEAASGTRTICFLPAGGRRSLRSLGVTDSAVFNAEPPHSIITYRMSMSETQPD